MTDDQRVSALVAEITTCKTPLTVVLQPMAALSLAGLVIIALQHPDASGPTAQVGREFIEQVRTYFNDQKAAAVLDTIRP
jgi:hypothetical protein